MKIPRLSFGLMALSTVAMVAMVPGQAAAATGSTERISVATDGTQANADAIGPAISASGGYVAFASDASTLVGGDTNGFADVFVRDVQTGVTERVSVATDGTEANSNSSAPAITADGRYVTFISNASNLAPGATFGLFVHDRQTGTTELVRNDVSNDYAISADARHVAFTSFAADLVPSDTNNAPDVFVYDRQSGTLERVSVATDGTEGNGHKSSKPAISADGRHVAFESIASNLVAGDTNNAFDVFVHDRQTGTTERVSVATGGAEGNSDSFDAAISADGRHVAFLSASDDLVAVDANGANQDAFVHDRQTASTELVSVATDGTQAHSVSFEPGISADGRHITFRSSASNLVTGDTNAAADVFIHDAQTGATGRVSVGTGGTEANGGTFDPEISADGRHVTFESIASNLVDGDTNGFRDVFVHDRLMDVTSPALILPAPIRVDATSPDGAIVHYEVSATDDVDPAPQVQCVPLSGSTFPIGETTVTCSATDAAGNEATGNFAVTVKGADAQIVDATTTIQEYPISTRTETSLLATLSAAQRSLETGDVAAACGQLEGFTNQVNGFHTARKLTTAQAEELTEDANRIRAVLDCT